MSIKPEIINGNELTLDTFIEASMTLLPPDAHLLVDGKSYTPAELSAKADEVRTPFKAKRTAKTELKKLAAEVDEKRASIRLFVKSLQTGMKAYLGEKNPEIVKFGFKPDKEPRVLTAEELQARADKARATRRKNHTMGKRQKKSLDAAQPVVDPASGNGSSGTVASSTTSHVA